MIYRRIKIKNKKILTKQPTHYQTINSCTQVNNHIPQSLESSIQLQDYYSLPTKANKPNHGDHPIPSFPSQRNFHIHFHLLNNPIHIRLSPKKQSQKTSTRPKRLSSCRCTPTHGNHASCNPLQNGTKIWTHSIP